jgi:hypothetical protein
VTPQAAEFMDILFLLNETELTQIIRSLTGVIVYRSIGKDRMIELASNPVLLQREDWAASDVGSSTNDSRKRLQLFIEKNWNGIQSQLPCKGENRGRCTIYPCSEGRHVDCLLAAGPHLKVHDI